jgi:hypothetical protein
MAILWLLLLMLLLMVVVTAEDVLLPRKWEGWWTRCRGGLDDGTDAAVEEDEDDEDDEVKMLSCGKAPSQALPGRELGAERGVEAGGGGGGGGMISTALVGEVAQEGSSYAKWDDGMLLRLSWRRIRAPVRRVCVHGCVRIRIRIAFLLAIASLLPLPPSHYPATKQNLANDALNQPHNPAHTTNRSWATNGSGLRVPPLGLGL